MQIVADTTGVTTIMSLTQITVGVGSLVKLIVPYGKHHSGKVVDIYGMRSAAGNLRTKYVVEFPHNRTKTKTVRVAYELTDFDLPF